jgi:HSP20 family protein
MTALTRREWWPDPFEWVEHLTRPAGRLGFRIEDEAREDAYVLRAELPGIDPDKDVQVSVTDGTLTIHAERREQTTTPKRSEFRYGELSRSVTLPTGADPEQVTARYADGILEVTVPITKTAKPRTIPISHN